MVVYFPSANIDDRKMVCYLASWAHYRPGNGSYTFDELAKYPFLCTHIIYTFAGLDMDGHIKSLDPENDVIKYSEFYGIDGIMAPLILIFFLQEDIIVYWK